MLETGAINEQQHEVLARQSQASDVFRYESMKEMLESANSANREKEAYNRCKRGICETVVSSVIPGSSDFDWSRHSRARERDNSQRMQDAIDDSAGAIVEGAKEGAEAVGEAADLVASVLNEPYDYARTASDVAKDPGNPVNYAGFVPLVPGGPVKKVLNKLLDKGDEVGECFVKKGGDGGTPSGGGGGGSTPPSGSGPKPQKAVPNPDGKKGGPRHQAHVEDEVRDMQKKYADNPDIEVRTERRIVCDDGQVRYVDVSAVKKSTGEVVDQVQVGRTTKGGLPVSRERRNMEDIDRGTGVDTRYRAWDK